ncbi:hypothetical protein VNO77_19197 [Canavalia gladiata]|uniref:Uncharacterized protein n=1 Tax=Canavalia gladiata TaxID=3824 RepID=A0AAN9LM19_CANGL
MQQSSIDPMMCLEENVTEHSMRPIILLGVYDSAIGGQYHLHPAKHRPNSPGKSHLQTTMNTPHYPCQRMYELRVLKSRGRYNPKLFLCPILRRGESLTSWFAWTIVGSADGLSWFDHVTTRNKVQKVSSSWENWVFSPFEYPLHQKQDHLGSQLRGNKSSLNITRYVPLRNKPDSVQSLHGAARPSTIFLTGSSHPVLLLTQQNGCIMQIGYPFSP